MKELCSGCPDIHTCTWDAKKSFGVGILKKVIGISVFWNSVRSPRNNKELYLVGDFNINVLDYENNVKVKDFVNFAFQNSLIPVINKPTSVTRTNTIAIDHILTNAFLNKQIETGITKTEILDHFLIFVITDPITSSEIKNKRTLIYERIINTATKENFKNILARKTWDYILKIGNLNEAYSKFLYDFSSIYEEAFLKLEIRIKQKTSLVLGLLME